MRIIFVLISACIIVACERTEVTVADDELRYAAITSDGRLSVSSDRRCISDLRTGLVWEIKTEDGLQNWRNTYSWYAPDEPHDELDYRGAANSGACSASDCDTYAYVLAVNSAKLCGFDDWRLPSRDELFSISDLRKAKTPPTADLSVFPHTQIAEYWTAHDYSFEPSSAWAWSFEFGHDRVDWKKSPKYLRLVRGTATHLAEVKE